MKKTNIYMYGIVVRSFSFSRLVSVLFYTGKDTMLFPAFLMEGTLPL